MPGLHNWTAFGEGTVGQHSLPRPAGHTLVNRRMRTRMYGGVGGASVNHFRLADSLSLDFVVDPLGQEYFQEGLAGHILLVCQHLQFFQHRLW